MAVVTATPPDSDTEVIVAVDEAASEQCEHDVPLQPPVQKLYRHDCEYHCCASRWAKFAVHQEEQDDLEAEVSTVPIVQRHVYSHDNKDWVTDSFKINCHHMRAFLSETLANYQDLDLGLEGWTFTPPYMPLVHRWERLQALHSELKDSADDDTEKKDAVQQLVDFLQPLLAPSVEDFAATQSTGMINCDVIWHIFPPGEVVLTRLFGADAVCRVVKYRRSQSRFCWLVTVEYVDWDGERCGLQRLEIEIGNYIGRKRVASLPVYPLSFADRPEEIKASVLARGRRFEQLRGFHFRSYGGVKVLMDTGERQPMTGRVIIDAYAYYRSNNIVKPDLRSLDGSESVDATGAEAAGSDDEYQPAVNDDGDQETNGSGHRAADERVEDLTELSDEHALLTAPWLIGFDLKAKNWGRFLVENLDDIVWNDKCFDNLVLPGGEKELAWEFVQSKSTSTHSFDDFVAEKGRGLIILMFGPPGVGKTYTAEAVAEKARVPLYLMSAGMLGTSPEVVEPALERALELCRMWNAMLLLDEADVFLGARLDDSLVRNELVSIFLTKLEYYQGILFLTTNRFSRIDHSFQSRVDLFLPYHDLGLVARKQVWNNFLDHFGRDRFEVGAEDIERLSDLPLNGREIKNLLKSAQLLTLRAGGKVTAERLYTLADKRVQAMKLLADHNANAAH